MKAKGIKQIRHTAEEVDGLFEKKQDVITTMSSEDVDAMMIRVLEAELEEEHGH